MTVNSLINYCYLNKIDFDKDVEILTESVISVDETALCEDKLSLAISHDDKHLVLLPLRVVSDKDSKKELKYKKIDTIESEDIPNNMCINLKFKELSVKTIKDILIKELNFKEFAEVSLINGKIFIQVSEKAKLDKIKRRFYGYDVLFDKMNSVWFKNNKDLDFHWEYGKQISNKGVKNVKKDDVQKVPK